MPQVPFQFHKRSHFSSKIFKYLITISVSICFCSFLTYLLTRYLGNQSPAIDIQQPLLGRWFRLIYVDTEWNIPSWFNSSLWLKMSLISFAISILADKPHQKSFQRNSRFLGIIAALASADEFMMLHERLGSLGISIIENLDIAFLYIASHIWVLPGMIIAILVGLLLLRYVWNLPSRVRNRIFIAGFLFLSATIIIETLSGYWVNRYGYDVYYTILVHIEETLEMSAVSLAIVALLQLIHITRKDSSIHICLEPSLSF